MLTVQEGSENKNTKKYAAGNSPPTQMKNGKADLKYHIAARMAPSIWEHFGTCYGLSPSCGEAHTHSLAWPENRTVRPSIV